MSSLEVTSTLTLADWQAYQAAWALRLQSRSRLSRRTLLGVVAVALMLAVVIVLVAVRLDQPVPFLAVVIGACAAVLGVMINMRRVRAASQPDEEGVVLGPSRLRLDAEGIHLEKPHSRILHGWAVFQEVTHAPEHLFIWIDQVVALIVPLRDLPAPLTAAQAIEQIQALAAAAAPSPIRQPLAAEVTPAPSIAPPARPAPTRFLQSIARFLVLRPVDSPALNLSDRSLFGIALITLAAWLMLDRALADPGSLFYVYGLLGVGWYASVILLIAMLWARLSQPTVPFRSALALALGFVPVAIALTVLILRYVPESGIIGALILVAFYATGYGHTGLRSLTSRHQPRALFAGVLALSLAASFAYTQYVTAQFWYADEDTAETSAEDSQSFLSQWQQQESLLFGQAELIDELTEAFDRPDDVPVAAFFVGFAGMGEERVFAGEIDLASRVIAEQFGTSDRSLLLVNNRRDLTSHPFANLSALQRGLSGVAAHMDLDRDVLFLALASHGSEDGELSVSNGGMPFNNLSAADLATALNESGIRWRVIFVSACYSGQFIEPLRDDYTIVITASAADRTSFGCADDRDLTYFGEAFYRDALGNSPDLRTAFQRMQTAIAQREQEEDIEPSKPQAHFGPAIERHLRELHPAG